VSTVHTLHAGAEKRSPEPPQLRVVLPASKPGRTGTEHPVPSAWAGATEVVVVSTAALGELVARLLEAGTSISGSGRGGDEPARRAADPARLWGLTRREREVFEQLARGASNAEIAAGLVLSNATVKTHVGRILAKLGLRDRAQAIVFAYETGFVQPGVDSAPPPHTGIPA
jgi:DNA-binding CsgD family transcriptional regulator